MLETSELWEQENGVKIIYRSFHSCLSGASRDLWDQINILDTFRTSLKKLSDLMLIGARKNTYS
jgi:hypothetical protein